MACNTLNVRADDAQCHSAAFSGTQPASSSLRSRNAHALGRHASLVDSCARWPADTRAESHHGGAHNERALRFLQTCGVVSLSSIFATRQRRSTAPHRRCASLSLILVAVIAGRAIAITIFVSVGRIVHGGAHGRV